MLKWGPRTPTASLGGPLVPRTSSPLNSSPAARLHRPSGPRASGTAPLPSVPLRAPQEILQQYRVPTLSSSRLPERPSVLTEQQRRAERQAERKQRELFVGNLASGSVRLP